MNNNISSENGRLEKNGKVKPPENVQSNDAPNKNIIKSRMTKAEKWNRSFAIIAIIFSAISLLLYWSDWKDSQLDKKIRSRGW